MDKAKKSEAVILAAGSGSRMHPLSSLVEKPCLPILNQPLIIRQLNQLENAGIESVLIVVKPNTKQIKKLIESKKFKIKISFVEQPTAKGTGHALSIADALVSDEFIVLLGDIYYPSSIIKAISEHYCRNVCRLFYRVETSWEAMSKNFAVVEGPKGRVREVIEKPTKWHSNKKGIGLFIFNKNIFPIICNGPLNTPMGEPDLIGALQVLVSLGEAVYSNEVSGNDFNLTNCFDAWVLNMRLLKETGSNNIMGHNLSGCTSSLVNCVIGNNVVLGKRSRYKNCLVLDNVSLPDFCDIENAIIHPKAQISISNNSRWHYTNPDFDILNL